MDADKDVLQTTKGRLWMLYVRKGMTKVSGVMCTWERSCKLELAAVYINNCVSSQSSFLFWLFTLLSISLGRERDTDRQTDRQTDSKRSFSLLLTNWCPKCFRFSTMDSDNCSKSAQFWEWPCTHWKTYRGAKPITFWVVSAEHKWKK